MTVVWGIDPSSKRIAVVHDSGDERAAVSINYDLKLKGAARLADIYVRTLARTRELPTPLLVVLEQPYAHNVYPSLYMCLGVQALAIRHATGADVQFVPPPTWKKVAVGHGAANKDQIAAWCEEWHLEFANQDEADAHGICDYAKDLHAKRERDDAHAVNFNRKPKRQKIKVEQTTIHDFLS